MGEEIKVNLENLSENERKTLLSIIEKGNKKSSSIWKPKDMESYWYVDSFGAIRVETFYAGNRKDENSYIIGNCFCTQEQAEEAAERIKVQTKWRRLSIEAGENENPWDGEHYHFSVYADIDDDDKTIQLECTTYKRSSDIYFPSLDSLEEAIDSIGENNIKKYILNIKD